MEERWKVGELARRSGVSVRTLHHYDQIGLLKPAGRTRAGHRLYGPDQVRRLHQIASLRQVGLALDEIGDLLDQGGLSLEEALSLQLERLRTDIERKTRLTGLLEELRERIGRDGQASLEEVTRTLTETLRAERYFTPEQLQALATRRETLGEGRVEEAQEAWRALLDDYAGAMRDGLDPAVPRVLELARRSRALVEAFTGGDAALLDSLREMYATEGEEAVLARRGLEMPSGLWDYMARAAEALRRDGGGDGSVPSP